MPCKNPVFITLLEFCSGLDINFSGSDILSNSSKIIIGMTGPFGSGCTYISKSIINDLGYEYISLSDILRKKCAEQEENEKSRTELQDIGNKIREENGNDILAKEAIDIINNSDKNKFVIDSIRNTHEIETFKKEYSSFFLFAVWANKDIRWQRVKDKYDNNNALFEKDDVRDSNEKIENGQQITLCYQMADVIILNEKHIHSKATDSFRDLNAIANKYIDLIESKSCFEPSEMETLMTMAYANSMRSSCTQRKVGALIIDNYGNVFSSGYNEVPSSERPCINQYGMCYRKYLRANIDEKLNDILHDTELTIEVSKTIKNNSKMLDYCRALHAEESAIINMARLSVSADLSGATLYTTTYPCNLCANKIAQVGIKHIIYYEPYPQEEAKNILNKHNVKQIPFEGITFNGYFRFMEVLR